MTIKITNRDLLRNYKSLKDRLLNGELDEIIIPQKSDFVLKIVLQKKEPSFQKLLKRIKKKPIKNIKRPKEDII